MLTKKLLIVGCVILCFIQSAFAQSRDSSNNQCSFPASRLITVQEIKKVYLLIIDNSLSDSNNKTSSEETDFFNIETMSKINSIENLSLEEVELLKTRRPEIKSQAIYAFKRRLTKTLPIQKWFDDSLQ